MLIDLQTGMVYCTTYWEWLLLTERYYAELCQWQEGLGELEYRPEDAKFRQIGAYSKKSDGSEFTMGSYSHCPDPHGYVYCFNGGAIVAQGSGGFDYSREKEWRKTLLEGFNVAY